MLAFATPVMLALLPACGGHICSCKQQCEYFNHDSVVVCSVNYPTDSAFQAAVDSATAHYGATTKDSMINYQSFRQNTTKVSQLESQGYHCACFANGW